MDVLHTVMAVQGVLIKLVDSHRSSTSFEEIVYRGFCYVRAAGKPLKQGRMIEGYGRWGDKVDAFV
jgi:hypothetical protein